MIARRKNYSPTGDRTWQDFPMYDGVYFYREEGTHVDKLYRTWNEGFIVAWNVYTNEYYYAKDLKGKWLGPICSKTYEDALTVLAKQRKIYRNSYERSIWDRYPDLYF